MNKNKLKLLSLTHLNFRQFHNTLTNEVLKDLST